MLSPDLPLKLSAAGIRLTGYVIESNLRVAQVFGQAALEAGSFSGRLKAKAAQPCARKEAVVEAKSAVEDHAPAPRAAVAAPKPKVAWEAAKPAPVAEARSVAEVKPAIAVEAKAAPVSEAEPAPVARSKPAAQRAARKVKATHTPDQAMPARTKATDEPVVKRPRAPSMPPALPEPVKKTKSE
ncbi:hypothetical protein SAMN05443999_103256 [Roseovarius azorensis]|uniref:Uncharacterized protein n=1 Tax=Roseovarius azorensis TaxID=1287727 RepID=A0A1H7MB13_9RHOB|nr:hypothetical protein [Roseovarius azorensis]SEL08352.1 hypothetical protein SAMN05443999_103256 [Roseovarius azorensis]